MALAVAVSVWLFWQYPSNLARVAVSEQFGWCGNGLAVWPFWQVYLQTFPLDKEPNLGQVDGAVFVQFT